MSKKYNLLTEEIRAYKPFRYPWCYTAWETQQKMHWLPEEVPLGDDVKDWKTKLNDNERNLLTQIFRFFTTADVEISNCYMQKYMPIFKPTEVKMMLSAFANMESIHIAAYSLLLDTIGMPESEYQAFMKYKEMKDKYDFLQTFDVNNKREIAKTLAAFGAFSEGVSLFASFVILLNFTRFNKMKGMGQIVSWSVRDECFVEGTEILTTTGWKDFSLITTEDKVAQYNQEDETISFVKSSRIVNYDIDDKIVSFSSQKLGLNFSVTKNHDVLYFYEYNNKYIKEKSEIYTPHGRKLIPVAGKKLDGKKILTPLERLFIAFQADGSFPDERHTGEKAGYLRANISVKKERKINRLKDLLAQADLSYNIKSLQNGSQLFRINFPLNISKTFSDWINLNDISIEWCQEFIKELMHWDGHDKKGDGTQIYYSTTSDVNADMVQAISVLGGYRCYRGIQHDNRKKTYKPVHRLTMKETNKIRTQELTKTFVPYKGKVYCVTVPHGNIVIRYKNSVCISGNSLHCENIIKLFRTFVKENKEVWDNDLKKEIYEIAEKTIELEDKFIDLAFEQGGVEGLTAEEVKQYIRYICDRRLIELGMKTVFKVKNNPLPWVDYLISGVEHTNFFENRPTSYAKAATTGTWENAYNDIFND